MREPGPTRRRFMVEHLDEVDSTNCRVLDAARAGAPEGLVVVADHQTAGRGRLGRQWTAPPGASLLVSVLLRPDLPTERLHHCTAAAALAMADAVGTVAGFVPDLKWPNDLVVDGRKLAGLLAEVDVGRSATTAVVVGLGVNVNWGDFPAEIAATATACNVVAGREVSRDDLLVTFLGRLDWWLDASEAALVDAYRARLVTIGSAVRVDRAEGPVTGVARSIDDSGALVVETAHDTVTVAAGDVIHLRPA